MVDTSVFVALDRQQAEVKDLFAREDHLLVSTLTIAELREGVLRSAGLLGRERRQKILSFVLQNCEIAGLDLAAALEFAHLRVLTAKSGKPRGAIDLMIAATARVHRAEVLTFDTAAGFHELMQLPAQT